ncbi:DUF1223 domain-containing protein [Sedimenticola selenatireducens]|uniref:DUF1223 domain-containing protein n=1 Tax=Sedimenticola selenatireducens TaxID=191960 RepID=A0A557SMR2_9GAMM|nr:DUF1223 domain-containing protein [Sedimenticola selenatireducens]TVO78709.1 DUF1223 domain-containing protein [Sedimenticola selenatireducens]TVT62071.1 MAG: DUF1223 domain-containing protein [Sedimenticola selenatireducens]
MMNTATYVRSLCYSLLFGSLFVGSALAETVRFASSQEQVVMVELYTSEGCSSCPPAEAWLNRFVDDEKLWKQVIPMAFHVDYWDYIGWKDRFAQARFSNRQYRYQKEGGIRTVYTPGVLLNGKEWRSRSSSLPEGSGSQTGSLSVEISDQGLSAQFDPVRAAQGDLRLYVAVLAFGINTEVAAGENSGRALAHEFVVVGLSETESSDLTWRVKLPEVKSVGAKRHAVVAWVSQANRQRPLQAVGGWITELQLRVASH